MITITLVVGIGCLRSADFGDGARALRGLNSVFGGLGWCGWFVLPCFDWLG